MFTIQGDTVFNPFAGSGITADCCNRNWICCELGKDMFEKAKAWQDTYDKQLVSEYTKTRVR